MGTPPAGRGLDKSLQVGDVLKQHTEHSCPAGPDTRLDAFPRSLLKKLNYLIMPHPWRFSGCMGPEQPELVECIPVHGRGFETT